MAMLNDQLFFSVGVGVSGMSVSADNVYLLSSHGFSPFKAEKYQYIVKFESVATVMDILTCCTPRRTVTSAMHQQGKVLQLLKKLAACTQH